jgi:hypothetical protein
LVVEGRRLYECTQTPLGDIAAMMGICRRTLENRIREWNWRRRRVASKPIDLFHAMRGAAMAAITADGAADTGDRKPISPQRRAAFAERILDVAEREIAAVGRVLDLLGPADQAEAMRVAPILAGLSRALREVAALNQTEAAAPDETDDDTVPSDIDEFREEVARRIQRFIDARRGRAEGSDSGDAGLATELP